MGTQKKPDIVTAITNLALKHVAFDERYSLPYLDGEFPFKLAALLKKYGVKP